DQFSDSIHIYDDQVKLQRKLSYPFARGATVFPVIQDRYTGIVYDLSKANGVYTLTAINPSFDRRISPRRLTISEVPLALNIQLFDDWVFFLIEENGFYGLHRIKMPVTMDREQTER